MRPGFSASADIITGTRSKAVAIPIQALVVREKPGSAAGAKTPQEEEGVYLVKDDKVQFAPVTTGLAGDSNIEIVKGLSEGQQIVTGPFRAMRELKEGSKVREQKEEKGKDGDKEKS